VRELEPDRLEFFGSLIHARVKSPEEFGMIFLWWNPQAHKIPRAHRNMNPEESLARELIAEYVKGISMNSYFSLQKMISDVGTRPQALE
jgi:hypothetical protein